MPLRASSLRQEDLRSIVLLGDEKFIRKEWDALANFPAVYIKVVSPRKRPRRFVAKTVFLNVAHVCKRILTNRFTGCDVR